MNKYIQFSETLLETLGIFDFGEKWSNALKFMLYITIVGTFFTSGILDLITTMDDFSRFAENFALLLVGFTGFVKYFTLIYSREKMRILRDVVKCNEILSGQELKIDDRSVVDNYDQAGLKFGRSYGWIIFVICQGFLLQALPGILLGHGLQLPFPAVYPFSLNSTTIFIIAYGHQIVGTHIYSLIYVAFDSWFIFLVHHACGHFCLLQNLLENIANADQQPNQIHERIVTCVRLHQNVFKFSENVEDVFNISNLIQFLVSSVAICISGYQCVITGFNEPQLLVKHLCSVYGQVVQLLIFNWCGQLMQEKSLGVTHAISRSKLYKLEVDHQRDLGLILLRAQRPAYITAGKFSNLSLLNFSNLLKTSMSYFTMLTSMQEN